MTSTFATRRLWLRRWHRVWSIIGIFVMWPFELLMTYIGWWKKAWGEALFVHIVVAFLGSMLGVVVYTGYLDVRGSKIATAEMIITASKADTCFDNTIKRRAADWKRPIKVKDVWDLETECAKFWEDKRVMAEQAKALK